MCKHVKHQQRDMVDLLAALKRGLPHLIAVSENCPACILAAIRQSGEEAMKYEWSYKEESEKWWAEIRTAEYEKDRQDEYNSMMADEAKEINAEIRRERRALTL